MAGKRFTAEKIINMLREADMGRKRDCKSPNFRRNEEGYG